MITMNSTEEERYNALKDRKLTVTRWNEENNILLQNPNESISKALLRFSRENNIIGSYIKPEFFRGQVKINAATIKESISSMVKQQSDLYNLGKLLTILPEVSKTAILIQIEPFRHPNGKTNYINSVYQYISAFFDQTYLYPVKITIEERSKQQDDNAHMVITVGHIPLLELQKEGTLSIPQWLLQSRENSDSGSMPSFNIMLPQLIKYFNDKESILIKNLPDGLLNDSQQKIKEKLIHIDKQKDTAKLLSRYQKILLEAAERGEELVYKVVPHEYSERMRKAMLDSNICFLPYTDENGYLNIVVHEKDSAAFLKVQDSVFSINNEYNINKNHNTQTLVLDIQEDTNEKDVNDSKSESDEPEM